MMLFPLRPQNPTFSGSLKRRLRRPLPHSPAVMRLLVASSSSSSSSTSPRRRLGQRIGSSFRWRTNDKMRATTTTTNIPTVIATTDEVQQSAECRDEEVRVITTTTLACAVAEHELEETTPNSFLSLEPPPYNDDTCNAADTNDADDNDDDHTEKTDDETASAPSQDDQEKDDRDEVTQIDSIDTDDGDDEVCSKPGRRVTFAPTYKEIRFRKHENTRAIWFSREDRKKTIAQCAREIADCVRFEPTAFRTLVDHCKAKQSSGLCDEFQNIMYVRGLLRPCLTRVAHADTVIRDWVQTPKRSVAAVMRVQEQGGGGANLDAIYRMHTEAPARWAHYLAVADAVEVQRKSPYEKVQV